MEHQELKRVIEALIFASDAPLTAERIRETLPEELNGADLNQLVDDLNRDYAESGRAFFIRQIAGGFQVTTRPELHTWVKKLFLGRNKMRLSQAALETLAIVAFKQPISRVDVAQIRGVNSDGVIGTLLEKKLITISGRSEGVGRPLLYSTTPEFLQYFGVNDLSDLPKPREIEELIGREGMPEEVLQALSDDKQLELPIELNAEAAAEKQENEPLPAPPASGETPEALSALVQTAKPKEAGLPPPAPAQGEARENETTALEIADAEAGDEEVDAILVEDPDSPDIEEGEDDSGFPDDEVENRSPHTGEDFFLEDLPAARLMETPPLQDAGPKETHPADGTMSVHEETAASRFSTEVQVVDLEAVAASSPLVLSMPEGFPAEEAFVAEQHFAEETASAGGEDKTDRRPAVQVIPFEPFEAAPVFAARDGVAPAEIAAPAATAASAGQETGASRAIIVAPNFANEDEGAPAPPHPETARFIGEAAPTSVVRIFLRRALGWIRDAWQKIRGR